MRIRKKIFWELLRKAFHLSSLLILVLYTLLLNHFSERIAILVLTALLLIFLEIEHIRLEHKPKLAAIFDAAFRKREKNNVNSSIFVIISCIICFSAFNYWVASLAMFMMCFGDIFSAVIGKTFGKTIVYNNKTYIGTMAGFTANVIAGILILPESYYLVFPMAFIASLVELITNKLDDNLTVPLFAGFVGQMIVYFFDIYLPPIDFSFLGLF